MTQQYDPERPSGYQDADVEIRELEDLASYQATCDHGEGFVDRTLNTYNGYGEAMGTMTVAQCPLCDRWEDS